MNKKAWVGITVAVLLVGAVIAAFWLRRPQEPDAISIGAILPLTGTASLLGKGVQEGIQMAVDEINASGGIDGRPLVVIIEDSRNHPKEGVGAFHKLVATERPIAIISEMSSVSKALAPLAERNHIVLFATVTAAPDLTGLSPWVFRNYYSTRTQGEAIAKFVREHLKLTKIGILHLTDDYGVTGEKELRNSLRNHGIVNVSSEGYAKEATDVRAQATKLIGKGVQGICVIAYDEALARAFKQIRELGYKRDLFTYTGLANPRVLESAGTAAGGAYVAMADYDPSSPHGQVQISFVTKYKAKYGHLPSHYPAFGYDTVRSIAHVLNEGESSPLALRDGLARMSGYQGVMGEIRISATREVEFPQKIRVVRKGRIVPLP